MRGHSYKHKRGMYFRGRSRTGRYYTRTGCLLPILLFILVLSVIIFLNI